MNKFLALFRQPEPKSALEQARQLADKATAVFRQSLQDLSDALVVLFDEIDASQSRQDELQDKAKAEKNLRLELNNEVELVENQMAKIEKILA